MIKVGDSKQFVRSVWAPGKGGVGDARRETQFNAGAYKAMLKDQENDVLVVMLTNKDLFNGVRTDRFTDNVTFRRNGQNYSLSALMIKPRNKHLYSVSGIYQPSDKILSLVYSS